MPDKISVVIATYNRREMLHRAVKSVLAMKYKNIEIIIVDDCSECDNYSMIQGEFSNAPIKYIRNSVNLYAAESRKVGFQEARGDYLIFLDDDDFYTDEYFFSKAMTVFNKNPKLSFVSGNAAVLAIESNEHKFVPLNVSGYIDGKEYLLNFQIKYKKPLSTFTTIFKRESIAKKEFLYNDTIFYLNALLWGDAYIIDDKIGIYCIHDNNISNHINEDFLIENVMEKHKIYLEIRDRGWKGCRRWWNDELNVTLKYYVLGTHKTLKDLILFEQKLSLKADYERIRIKVYLFLLLLKRCIIHEC